MTDMRAILNVLTLIGVVLGGFIVADSIIFGLSPPQQTAAATQALALAVLPYIFARTIDHLFKS